ncbi:hypothetical protein ACFXEL_25680 [Streptomyces sp. NPDC059382]|uniref:hypothetical protein n=1 Tax=Streptomyces sp. NPDC059382 TaxID=3346816 RepID=UPI0036BF7D12
MSGEHAAELEELGIVWNTADAAFAENLAAARAYFELHGTPATSDPEAPPTAAASSSWPTHRPAHS